jgi:16S rRNA (uracil1498-N3)-methyltransferase
MDFDIYCKMRRFYAPSECFNEDKITLNVDETRHLRDVLRLRVGDEVHVFDGIGNEFGCEIETIEKRSSLLKINEKVSPQSPESDLDLTLAIALLKGEKFDLVVQKAVELGVGKIIPIITKRTVEKSVRLERLRKIALDATKQCGRAKLLEIAETIEFTTLIELNEGTMIMFSERNGTSFSTLNPTKKIVSIIGPRGGWEDSELEFGAQKGVSIITFGGRILRAETASIALTAILQHNFGDLN